MRETNFIKQNKEKWREFEAILTQKKKDPDKLSELFIEITDDLSYSRTFYPNRSVRVYLNNIAQEVFYSVYKTKRLKDNRFINFWTDELPYVIYQSRKAFYLAFLVFAISLVIGVVSSMYDPTFSALILGEDYIAMTMKNIENGDPMGVYKDSDEMGMFLGITLNNLKVDFMTFISGLFASLGTLFVMMYNGIMVGTFQYFFVERGLFWESFLTIWVHGAIEIPTIIISGAAGLMLGSGLLFPGTYSRFQSFLVSARMGLKILMGVIPLTIIAGFIEGFFTRYTDAPPLLRGFFILSCFAFVGTYYIFYPWYKSKKGFNQREKNQEVFESAPVAVETNKLRGNGEVFADSFLYLKPFMARLVVASAVFAGLYAIYYTLVVMANYEEIFSSYYWSLEAELTFIAQIPNFFKHNLYPLLAIPNFLMLLFATSIIGFIIQQLGKVKMLLDIEFTKENWLAYIKSCWVSPLAFSAIVTGVFFVPSAAGWILFLPVLPFLSITFAVSIIEEKNFAASMGRALSLIGKQVGEFIGLWIMLLAVSFLFLWFPSTSIVSFYIEVVYANFILEPDSYKLLFGLSVTFITTIMFIIVLGMQLMAGSLFFYRMREQYEAPGLLEKVRSIGKKKSIYGLEQEF